MNRSFVLSGCGWFSLLLTATTLLASMSVVGLDKQAIAAPTQSVAIKNNAPTNPILRAIQNLKTSNKRWIEVNVTTQRLIAWEGNQPIHAVIISSGKPGTPTKIGVFAVQYKFESKRMQGDDYDVPDVPFTMFYDGNYAIHGAYWHNRFGTPVSHGCVNVAVDHAEWLFNWASVGTPVIVRQ